MNHMILIPIIILVAILGFSYGGQIVKDIQLGLSAPISNDTPNTPTPQKTTTPKTPAKSTQSSKPSSPRAPPVSVAPPPKTTASTNSPYLGKISISNFQATNSNPARITLSPNFSGETKINITGWRIKSSWNGEFTIPKGTSKLHPTPPIQVTENVILSSDDTAYLSGQSSPFGRGIDFKPNSCFGYLKQYYLNLPVSFSCYKDQPTLTQIKNLTPACQEFILNKIDYGDCKIPDYSNNVGVATNQECVSYITNSNFTYEGCFAKHNSEANFISNKWYIYMDTIFGNPLHDSITLYDQNGLPVDTYTY